MLAGMSTRRTQSTYDHRLVRLVQQAGDATLATRLGVPRSTAAGWVRRPARPVVTTPALDEVAADLRARLARLETRHELRGSLRNTLFQCGVETADFVKPRAGLELPAPPLQS